MNNSKLPRIEAQVQTTTPLLLWLLLDLFVLQSMQHDFVDVTSRHTGMTLGPIIRNGVGKDCASTVEGSGGYRPRRSVKGCK